MAGGYFFRKVRPDKNWQTATTIFSSSLSTFSIWKYCSVSNIICVGFFFFSRLAFPFNTRLQLFQKPSQNRNQCLWIELKPQVNHFQLLSKAQCLWHCCLLNSTTPSLGRRRIGKQTGKANTFSEFPVHALAHGQPRAVPGLWVQHCQLGHVREPLELWLQAFLASGAPPVWCSAG